MGGPAEPLIGKPDVEVTFRAAAIADACAAHELRRRSILKLAPEGMPLDRVQAWAEKGSIELVRRRLKETEAWVAEEQGCIVGWIAMRGDYVDALYVDPDQARRGIGAHLLQLVEAVLRRRGVKSVRADASWNSEAFYVSQGYQPIGPRPADDARPMWKTL